MEEFKKFYFENFEFNFETLSAKFYYSFDEKIFFCENIDFKNNSFILRSKIDKNIVNNFLFSIHIALGISYYKIYPTKELVLKTGFLDLEQIKFWKKFYLNGLGEFFYKNNINPKDLLSFIILNNKKFEKIDFNSANKSLVPVGGGKDSIVSIELLKDFDFDLFTFCVKDNILYENTANISNKKRLIIKRELSNNLMEINSKGYYNGHVPITGIIAFVMMLVAYIYDYKYLILSNEKSANFGNTNHFGIEINHQWSKSIDFENDLNKYIFNYLSSDILYFSILRPFYEIKIAKIFSQKAKKYFGSFSSCNKNFKIFDILNIHNSKKNYWCENCPKCAFVYSILRAFLDKQEILKIFSKDLYVDKDLEKTFRELSGISGIKPFECVGTNEEVIFAMYLAFDKYKDIEKPYFLNIFEVEILPKLNQEYLNSLEEKLFYTDIENSNIPEIFKKIIKSV